jgi:hypothetical protein
VVRIVPKGSGAFRIPELEQTTRLPKFARPHRRTAVFGVSSSGMVDRTRHTTPSPIRLRGGRIQHHQSLLTPVKRVYEDCAGPSV